MSVFEEYKAKQLRKKGPAFDFGPGAWIDRLLRPQYASVAVAKRLLDDRVEEVPEAIWRGLTGKEKGSYQDVARDMGLESPFWWGLAGDIALDPTTFIPVGKVAKPVVSAVSKIPGVAQAGKALRASPLGKIIGEGMIYNFRWSETPEALWKQFTKAKQLSSVAFTKDIGRYKNMIAAVSDDLRGIMKKGTIEKKDLPKLIASVERNAVQFGLPDEVAPVYEGMRKFFKTTTRIRNRAGKGTLQDIDLDYVLRQMSDEEKERLRRIGGDIVFREHTTKTASDIARQYLKFTLLEGPVSQTLIGKAKMFKLAPMKFTGISKEHLGELWLSTVKDLRDLEDLAKIYGIKLRFSPKRLTYGKNLGLWQPYGRIFRVATGGREQKGFISTVVHELAHNLEGEVGSMQTLFNRSVNFNKGVRKIVGQGKFNDMVKNFAILSDEAKVSIWRAMGLNDEMVKAKWDYYNDPAEIFARYAQIIKRDVNEAKAISPQLYDAVSKALDDKDISKLYKRIFHSPVNEGEMLAHDSVWKHIKTGQLYKGQLPDLVELDEKYPGLFSTDIPKLMNTAAYRISKVRSGKVFFDEVAELGSDIPIDGWRLVENTPELKGLHFPEQMAKEIESIRKAFVNEEVTKGFLNIFDNVQNLWKVWTLGVFPAYHVRNMFGNIWNNFLGGVNDPAVYGKALDLQNKVYRKIPLTAQERLMWKTAEKYGIVGRGFYGADVPSLFKQPSFGQRVTEGLEKPARVAMEKVGVPVEDNARLAHFIDKIKKGWSAQEAAFSTKKYLFDYSEITPFEQNVLKRLMPFYTWSRKNIPLQMDAIIQNTGKILALEKARRGKAQEAGEPPEQILPTFLRERMPWIQSRQGKDLDIIPLEGLIPYADVSKLGRPGSIVSDLLTPILRVPAEIAANKSWYFNEPIESYPGETKEFLRADMPAKVAYVARSIRLLNEIHRLIGFADKKKGPEQPELGARLGRLLWGVKTYRVDLKRAVQAKLWELKKELRALDIGLNRAEKYGRLPEQERVAKRIKELKEEAAQLTRLKF